VTFNRRWTSTWRPPVSDPRFTGDEVPKDDESHRKHFKSMAVHVFMRRGENETQQNSARNMIIMKLRPV
jgi:hypothetical protein